MSDAVELLEIVLCWIVILEILFRMIEGGLLDELKDLLIRRKRL